MLRRRKLAGPSLNAIYSFDAAEMARLCWSLNKLGPKSRIKLSRVLCVLCVCEVCEMWWTTFSLMTMRRTPKIHCKKDSAEMCEVKIAKIQEVFNDKLIERYHNLMCLKWSVSTCLRFVDCNLRMDALMASKRSSALIWRKWQRPISRSVNILLGAQLLNTSHDFSSCYVLLYVYWFKFPS